MDYSAANTAPWTPIIQLGYISVALLAAYGLCRVVPAIRKSMVPAAVIAGFVLLAFKLVGVVKIDSYFMEGLTYHGITIGFIALTLRVPERSDNDGSLTGLRSGAIVVSTYMVQGFVGLGITILLALTIMPNLFPASGILLPMGYGQGPGQANNIGTSYESLGFVGGRSFGVAIAAAGYLCACIVGVIYVNYLARKGKVSAKDPGYVSGSLSVKDFETEGEVPVSESVDRLSIQMVLVLAVYLAGSIPAFVERMNQKAGELGCEQTHFVDPHGLSYDDLTSARDLYRITREALGHPAFMELCDTRAYTVPASNKSGERQLKSSNALIAPDGVYGAGYLYEGAHGVKTGYTRAAGYCLISTAEREGLRLMAIVLGCDGPYLSDTETRYSFVDSARLYDWAFSGFTLRCLLSEYDLVGSAPVTDGREEQVGLRPLRSVFAPLPKDADPAGLTLSLRLYDEPLTAPLRAGQVLGQVQVLYEGQLLVTEELAAAAPVPLRFWLRLARALTD